MTTERLAVRVLLLFGDQAEFVADVPSEERADPERYPAAESLRPWTWRSVTCQACG